MLRRLIRVWRGVIAGSLASVMLVGVVMAGQSNGHWTNVSAGQNTVTWRNAANGTVYFRLKNCLSSSASVKVDLMHHWPAFPSTGTAEKWVSCVNSTLWRSVSWSGTGSGVDYSVEVRSAPTVTTDWRADYP